MFCWIFVFLFHVIIIENSLDDMKWIQSKYSTTKWLDTDLKSEWVSEKINFNIAISYQRGKEFTNGSNYKTQN